MTITERLRAKGFDATDVDRAFHAVLDRLDVLEEAVRELERFIDEVERRDREQEGPWW